MQGNRGSRVSFSGFGDPFNGFDDFGAHRSLMSSIFGGRDPFDDPFFSQPFGGLFESNIFGSRGSLFHNDQAPVLEHQAPVPPKSKGPIIEEIDSEDEKDDAYKRKKEASRKHGRSNRGPYITEPDDNQEERKSKNLQLVNDYGKHSNQHQMPQNQCFTFQSSSVTYGGTGGTFYTSSKARRTGSDGVTVEELKEANSGTGKATHVLSRGLHNKGHTVARKLKSDGKVETMQTLHNLEQDELPTFEEAWSEKAGQYMPTWNRSMLGQGSTSRMNQARADSDGWALPSNEHGLPSYGPSRGAIHEPRPARARGSFDHTRGRPRG